MINCVFVAGAHVGKHLVVLIGSLVIVVVVNLVVLLGPAAPAAAQAARNVQLIENIKSDIITIKDRKQSKELQYPFAK